MYWFLIKSILMAVLGSQFYKWYASTKIGIYFQNRINQFMNYVSKKCNIILIKRELKFKRDYPLIIERLEKLEKGVFHLEHRQDASLYNKVNAKLGRLDHELEDDAKV